MSATGLRVLVAQPGLDGHDRGAWLVARALREAGFEVVYSGLRQTPDQVAQTAVDDDVDLVGLSIVAGGHCELTRKVVAGLRARGAGQIPVVVGGVIPEDDVTLLKDAGAAAAFPSSTSSAAVVRSIEKLVRRHRREPEAHHRPGRNRATPALNVGFAIFPAELAALTAAERAALVGEVAAAGLDHLCVSDHVSFRDGGGFDGFVAATATASLHDRLPILLGLYLLGLRHPVLVARQVATFTELFPGRLVLGVGVGGDDRREIEMCGVDPTARGARTDEALTLLRLLLTGQPVSAPGPFFPLEEALIRPAPDPPVPLVVGGRSDAALRRAGRLGDGWLGLWISANRFADAVEQVAKEAAAAGRGEVAWRHGFNVWCGIGPDRVTARRHLNRDMESLYHLPAERFERWCPAGSPEEVAAFIAPYLEAGASDITLVARAAHPTEAAAGAAEVRRLLLG